MRLKRFKSNSDPVTKLEAIKLGKLVLFYKGFCLHLGIVLAACTLQLKCVLISWMLDEHNLIHARVFLNRAICRAALTVNV